MKEIKELLQYALDTHLIEEADVSYCTNRILDVLGMDAYNDDGSIPAHYDEPQGILDRMMDQLVERGKLEDGSVFRDLMDSRIMDAVTPWPSVVRKAFHEAYNKSPKEATDYYYAFSKATNYVRTQRIAKDRHWKCNTVYGDLDITINLSKPEKDPKAIAMAASQPSSNYPSCLLCKENEGYAGTLQHPARNNHRIIPITLHDTKYNLQYSPYAYYNEHCIIFHDAHTPMHITKDSFACLLDFVDVFPHYFIGSNTDIPIVGGSILSHDHFQGGHYTFAMEKANMIKTFNIQGFEGVEAGIVNWPLSVLRARSTSKANLCSFGEHVLKQWIAYQNESCDIIASTNGERHNAITPIVRKNGEYYEFDFVLRNNHTSEQYPDGIFHPHAHLHHIKKENIGLIEVLGLAILPKRLIEEMELMKPCLINRDFETSDETMQKHIPWLREIVNKYDMINEDNVETILEEEIGLVFCEVLENAGVFKQDASGLAGFENFIQTLHK